MFLSWLYFHFYICFLFSDLFGYLEKEEKKKKRKEGKENACCSLLVLKVAFN